MQTSTRIREATPADAAAIATVHVDSWRSTYSDVVPEEYLASLSYEAREGQWSETLLSPKRQSFIYVAEDDDRQVIGWAAGGPERSGGSDYAGEMYAIYLLLEYQRQGIGRRLAATVALSLAASGLSSMLVWVLALNPACAFYEAIGGQLIGERQATVGGRELREVAYGWKSLTGLTGVLLK
jgi:ribosomal protein S18 acetylase RimI-like enzyme